MYMIKQALPIGVDNFEEIVESNYYYVDKTLLIKELLDKKGKVNLFTRPRRFGKSLNLSMLRYYFENVSIFNKDNSSLFEDLKIMSAGEEYVKELGKYPVISLSLKSAKQPNFEMAYEVLQREIRREFERHKYVLNIDYDTDIKFNTDQIVGDAAAPYVGTAIVGSTYVA